MATENYAPPSTLFSRLRGYNVVRVALGLLLVLASGLKAFDLWTNPTATDTRLLPVNLQIAVVEVEALLGFWLLSGLWQRGSWIAAFAGFSLLASVSLDFAVHKLPCGCFGRLGTGWELSAWQTFVLDLVGLAALWRWRPALEARRVEPVRGPSSWRLAYVTFLTVVFVGANGVAFLIPGAQAGNGHNIVEELPASYSAPGSRLIHTFTVKNHSGQFQRILKVTHSCLCSKATIERTDLAPGDATKLHLEADLTGHHGAETFHSFLWMESGERWIYSVKTQILQPVTIQPQSIHFGLLDPGEKKTQPADVVLRAAPGERTPKILAVVPQSENLTVAWSGEGAEASSDSGGAARRLAVSVAADVAPGTSSGAIAVRYQLGGQEHESLLSVSWTVRTLYEVNPPRVFIMKPDGPHKQLKRAVIIKRLDDRPISIRALRTTDPVITCRAILNAAALTQELAIAIDSEVGRQTITGEVIIETDDLSQSKIEIPVTVINR